MQIVRYERLKNNIYKIYMDDGEVYEIYENVILKNNLLFKRKINKGELKTLIDDNYKEQLYQKCLKYINYRLRSEREARFYLINTGISDELVDEVINRLKENNYINDEKFTRAFINDKLQFSTMGPVKIKYLLKEEGISDGVIDKYLMMIDREIIDNKIKKEIVKGKKREINRNKIYHKLYNMGYYQEDIMRNLREFESE